MGHNFDVESHFKFKVEIGEKSWSMPASTVPIRQEKLHVGKQFLQNLLLKKPLTLCKL
jgi:hypothetical protein